AGHGGSLQLGEWAGQRVLVFEGRLHYYEGHPWRRVVEPVQTAAYLGAKILLLTNAAGGIHDALTPGSLMAVRDHFEWPPPHRRPPPAPGGPAPAPPVAVSPPPGAAPDASAPRAGHGAVPGRLRRRDRAELRNAGRSPRLEDLGGRRGGHVHGPRSADGP